MSAQSAHTSGDSRGHVPTGQWAFDEEVTDCFEDMLVRSIPQYETMREATFALACNYRTPKSAIIDLGASRGDGLARLVDAYGATNRFVAVEVADPMLKVLRERFAGLIDCGVVDVRDDDLRTAFPPVREASVVQCILTLQFTPIEYRQDIMRRAYDALAPGGCLLLVEKILGASAQIDKLMVGEYLSFKSANGYTEEEITRKRLSLEGALVPLTAAWNEGLMKETGFATVDCFWRWMNFAGWVAVK